MSEEKRELLEKLKFELAFVEDGGYGRSVRTPHKPTSPFQDSLTCLNFGDPSRTHPCAECILMQYVPESRKGEDVPCHHIPLDQESSTILENLIASQSRAGTTIVMASHDEHIEERLPGSVIRLNQGRIDRQE